MPRTYLDRIIERLRTGPYKDGTRGSLQRGQALAGELQRGRDLDVFRNAGEDVVRAALSAMLLRLSSSSPAPRWGRNFGEAIARLLDANKLFDDAIDVEAGRELHHEIKMAELAKQSSWVGTATLEKIVGAETFRAEHLGTFAARSEAQEKALEIWRRYYWECEDYDRTVCTGPIMRGGYIMPATGAEQVRISKHARVKMDQATQSIQMAGITNEVSEAMRKVALDEPYAPPTDPRRAGKKES